MKVVAVVPIKLDNERLPNKNVTRFDNGEPLISYILQTLLAVENINEVYVYCSDEGIRDYLPNEIKFVKRSKLLDSADTKINEILFSFAEDVPGDIYVLAHATSPFIQAQRIDEGLSKVMWGGYDSAFAVQKVQEFLWRDGEPFNYDLAMVPRTQDLPPLYSETSGFYVFTRDLIINTRRRIGFSPYLVEVPKMEAIDIDEKEDFDIANAIFNWTLRKDGSNE